MTDAEIIEIIRQRLTPKRFAHSLAVAEQARSLAIRYGADADRLFTAGLLHDAMKDSSPEEQLKLLDESAIILSDIEKNAFKLWHAVSGRAFAERIIGIRDEEILTAIRYHTTGRAGMSRFEKLLYVADFTSADRDYEGVEAVRAAAESELDAAVEEGLVFTVAELAEKRQPIHPDTLEAYNEILFKRKS